MKKDWFSVREILIEILCIYSVVYHINDCLVDICSVSNTHTRPAGFWRGYTVSHSVSRNTHIPAARTWKSGTAQ